MVLHVKKNLLAHKIYFSYDISMERKPQIRVIVSPEEYDAVRAEAERAQLSVSSLARVKLGLAPNPTPGGAQPGSGRPRKAKP